MAPRFQIFNVQIVSSKNLQKKFCATSQNFQRGQSLRQVPKLYFFLCMKEEQGNDAVTYYMKSRASYYSKFSKQIQTSSVSAFLEKYYRRMFLPPHKTKCTTNFEYMVLQCHVCLNFRHWFQDVGTESAHNYQMDNKPRSGNFHRWKSFEEGFWHQKSGCYWELLNTDLRQFWWIPEVPAPSFRKWRKIKNQEIEKSTIFRFCCPKSEQILIWI